MAPAARRRPASPSRPASARRPGGLAGEWNGLPVWTWVVIGGASLAGLVVFARGYRASRSASGGTTGSTAAPDLSGSAADNWGAFGGHPFLPSGGSSSTPLPTPGGTAGGAPPPVSGGTLPPSTTAPPPTAPAAPAGHVYGIQDVLDLFARYNKSLTSTAGPTTESVTARVARILRDLNSGARTLAQVATSVAALPSTTEGAANNASLLGVGGTAPALTPNPAVTTYGSNGGIGPNDPNPTGQYGGGIAGALQQVVMSGQQITYGPGTEALQANVNAARAGAGVANPPALHLVNGKVA